jgi:hypothetical protein
VMAGEPWPNRLDMVITSSPQASLSARAKRKAPVPGEPKSEPEPRGIA